MRRLLLTIALVLLLVGCTTVRATLMQDGSIVIDYRTVLQNKTATVNRTAAGLEISYGLSNDPAVELAKQISALAQLLARAGAATP